MLAPSSRSPACAAAICAGFLVAERARSQLWHLSGVDAWVQTRCELLRGQQALTRRSTRRVQARATLRVLARLIRLILFGVKTMFWPVDVVVRRHSDRQYPIALIRNGSRDVGADVPMRMAPGTGHLRSGSGRRGRWWLLPCNGG